MSRECARVRAALPGYLDEELPADELQHVRSHLRDCARCRREAADYLQAQKALRRAATARLADGLVDDDALHDEILARVALEQRLAEAASPWSSRLVIFAAAALLAAFGFWLAGEAVPSSIWERPPIHDGKAVSDGRQEASPRGADTSLRALPYAGPPVDLRPVGFDEDGFGSAANGFGPGMLGRRPRNELGDLVAEEFVLPLPR